MKTITKIHCPNCGSHAEKTHFHQQNLEQISCPSCDYLIIHYPNTAKVIEVYAPGLKMKKLSYS